MNSRVLKTLDWVRANSSLKRACFIIGTNLLRERLNEVGTTNSGM
jgi:hypothetical protein